jgi:hypothetical protein
LVNVSQPLVRLRGIVRSIHCASLPAGNAMAVSRNPRIERLSDGGKKGRKEQQEQNNQPGPMVEEYALRKQQWKEQDEIGERGVERHNLKSGEPRVLSVLRNNVEPLAKRILRNPMQVCCMPKGLPVEQPVDIKSLHQSAHTRAEAAVTVVEDDNARARPRDKGEVGDRHHVEKHSECSFGEEILASSKQEAKPNGPHATAAK